MATIVSFHLQRFYIWILIFHHQPIRPPSHQQGGRDPPVMAGADSRFHHRCHYATAVITQRERDQKLSLFWWFVRHWKQGIPSMLAGFSKWCCGGAPGASRSLTTANTPGKAARGQELTVSLKQHSLTHKVREVSNQRWCHRRSMGIVGGIGLDHRKTRSAARQRGPGPKHV